jgi:hypothetical protein
VWTIRSTNERHAPRVVGGSAALGVLAMSTGADEAFHAAVTERVSVRQGCHRDAASVILDDGLDMSVVSRSWRAPRIRGGVVGGTPARPGEGEPYIAPQDIPAITPLSSDPRGSPQPKPLCREQKHPMAEMGKLGQAVLLFTAMTHSKLLSYHQEGIVDWTWVS